MSDLISREEILKLPQRKGYAVNGWETYIRVSDIKELPSVQPRKGKWIGYKADDKDWQRDDGSPVFMNCSECHEAVINNGSAHWNFCPNCGCRMEEGEQDE